MEEPKNLWDIEEIKIDKILSVNEKLQSFAQYNIEKNLSHKNEGYVVRVHFGEEAYSATDAVKQYLKQIAQLKY